MYPLIKNAKMGKKKWILLKVMGIVCIEKKLLKTGSLLPVRLDSAKLQLKNRKKNLNPFFRHKISGVCLSFYRALEIRNKLNLIHVDSSSSNPKLSFYLFQVGCALFGLAPRHSSAQSRLQGPCGHSRQLWRQSSEEEQHQGRPAGSNAEQLCVLRGLGIARFPNRSSDCGSFCRCR